jgi:hypothetical protein
VTGPSGRAVETFSWSDFEVRAIMEAVIGGWQRAAVVAALVAVVMAVAPAARAQGPFRVTFKVEKTGPAGTEITGQVTNDARAEVLDVYVTAEAVGGGGRVLARGVAHVGDVLRDGQSASFLISVPAVPGTARYRVSVSSYRQGFASQNP